MQVIINILLVILSFSILIIIHETGHFILAKLNGVKVEEFAIGMGPKIFGINGKETLYSLRAVPIGGYVKMLGEDGDSEDERAFSNKSPLRRLSIVSAGPIMNLLLAVVLFSFVSNLKGFLIPVVSDVVPQSPAMKAGIQVGDKITKVDNYKISTWDDFVTQISISKGKTMNITVLRNKEEKNMKVTPIKNNETNTYVVGIYSTVVEKPSLFQSINYGLNEAGSTIKQTFKSLGMIFKGQASKDDVGGPVTILRVTYAVSKAGIMNLMLFSAFISIQLGIFNLLPFPALDGFWIFVSIYQIITRKQVNKDKIGFINTIGFALLLLLMVLITIKDVLYPIKL